MKILVVNAGSSSLKYQLIDMDTQDVVAKGLAERIGIEGSKLTHQTPGKEKFVQETDMPNHAAAVRLVLNALTDPVYGAISDMKEIDAVGHRVLHGGEKFTAPALIDDEVEKAIEDCIPLGPLHNPANLMGIRGCREVMPDVPMVAVFDTAFGQAMEPKAYLYALPISYYEKHSVRRYGFHGTSHRFINRKVKELYGDGLKVICCHMGNGASVSAAIDGNCVDTSMGLTPLEGLMMGTRSGDMDPAIIRYIMNRENLTIDEMDDVMNKKSGLLGMTGISSDMRDILAAQAEGNEKAKNALDVYCYRVQKYIGAYTAAMQGVDVIVMTAGVGENNPYLRERVLDTFGWLGVKIDHEANNAPKQDVMVISAPDSKVKCLVLATNEELMIALDTLELVTGK